MTHAAGVAGIEAAVADLQEVVAADGAALRFERWDEAAGAVHLALVIEDAGCAECVVPSPMLERIALDRLRAAEAAVRSVVVQDPRPSPT